MDKDMVELECGDGRIEESHRDNLPTTLAGDEGEMVAFIEQNRRRFIEALGGTTTPVAQNPRSEDLGLIGEAELLGVALSTLQTWRGAVRVLRSCGRAARCSIERRPSSSGWR